MSQLQDWYLFAKTKRAILDNPSLDSLLSGYHEIKGINSDLKELHKLLAEICFLIAVAYKHEENSRARFFALESIELYQELSIKTLEDSFPVLESLLPDIMHEDVVRSRIII